MNKPENLAIPDVQSSADTRQIAIDKVGIKSIRHPVRVGDRNAGVHLHTEVASLCVCAGRRPVRPPSAERH